MRSRRSEIRSGASQKCASDAMPPAARIAWIASTGREARPRHVARLAVREEPPERVLDALGEPGRDEGAGDRRPAERVVRGEVEGRDLGVDRQPDLAQPLDRRVEAGPAGAALARRAPPRTPRPSGSTPIPSTWSSPSNSVEAEAARHGVDLDRRDERRGRRGAAPRRARRAPGTRRGCRGPRSANSRTPAVVRLADELGRLEDAVGAGRVGVDVGDRVAGDERLAVLGSRRVARRTGRRHQTSTRRWIRSIWMARPVAGSMSIWQALNTTGPSPTSNRVGSALMNRGRTVVGLEPDDAPDRTGHAEVGLIGRALGQDPLVARDDVGVRPDDDAHPPVEVQPERVLLARQLAVEVDEPDRRQRLARLVEQPVGVRERVLDRLHVRPALEVDDRDLGPVERLVRCPSRGPGPRACRS